MSLSLFFIHSHVLWNQPTRTCYLLFAHQPASETEWGAFIKCGETQLKHKVKSTAPRSSQQCFLTVPRGNAVERACHIKYQRETRSLCSNVKNAGKWKQNAATKTRKWKHGEDVGALSVLSYRTNSPADRREGEGSNATQFPYSVLLHYRCLKPEKQKMFQESTFFFCFFLIFISFRNTGGQQGSLQTQPPFMACDIYCAWNSIE